MDGEKDHVISAPAAPAGGSVDSSQAAVMFYGDKSTSLTNIDEALPVIAELRQQAGIDFFIGLCPRCGDQHACYQVGKVACRCGHWLDLQVSMK